MKKTLLERENYSKKGRMVLVSKLSYKIVRK